MSLFTSEITVQNLPLPVDGSAVIQPVSAAALPLPAGASTEATLAAIKAKTDNLDVLLSTRTKPADTQNISGAVTVSGSVSVGNFPATQPVSIAASVAVTGPLTDTQLRATPVPISGSITTSPVVSSSSTVAQVTSTGSNQTLLATNANRKKAILFFESGIWSVKLGSGASTTSRTYLISATNTSLEITTWTGQIDAVCTTSSKLVDVTELV